MKRSTKRLSRIIDENSDIGERVWTRLWKDDQREVAQLVSDDMAQATVIRDLVSEALHARRLKQAGRHPAIRELLKTFDGIINARVREAIEQTNERSDQLEAEQRRTNRFLAALFFTYHDDFRYTDQNTQDEAKEDALFLACLAEANQMNDLILKPLTPTRSALAASPPAASPE